MVVGRFSVSPDVTADAKSSIEVGVNAAYSKDTNVRVVVPQFKGDRILAGGDVRLTLNKILLSGEATYGRVESEAGTERDLFGFHATIGYSPGDKHQLLVRWDSFMADDLRADSNLLIVGDNLFPTQAAQIQANDVIPTDDFDIEQTQLLINAQIAF